MLLQLQERIAKAAGVGEGKGGGDGG
jgi:hypothetical protein